MGSGVSQGGLGGVCSLLGVATAFGSTCAPRLCGLNVRPIAEEVTSAQEQAISWNSRSVVAAGLSL